MTNYYIEKDDKIIFVDTDLERLQNTISFGEYSNLEIKETERPIENFEFTDTEEYLEKTKTAKKKLIILEYVQKFSEFDSMWTRNVSLGKKTSAQMISARANLQAEYISKLEEC